MGTKSYGFMFKLAQRVLRLVLPRYDFERPPVEGKPVVYISHHQNLAGPLTILVWINFYVRTWVLSVFTEREAAYRHYRDFTFTRRCGWPAGPAKLIARLSSYLVPAILNAGDVIPVYRKSRRIIETMKISHEALMQEESILIFPDVDYSSESKKTSDIYQGFLHLEKRYFKETKKHLTFVPLFSDSDHKIVRVGQEITFTGREKFIDEREKIADEIKNELNRLAQAEREVVNN